MVPVLTPSDAAPIRPEFEPPAVQQPPAGQPSSFPEQAPPMPYAPPASPTPDAPPVQQPPQSSDRARLTRRALVAGGAVAAVGAVGVASWLTRSGSIPLMPPREFSLRSVGGLDVDCEYGAAAISEQRRELLLPNPDDGTIQVIDLDRFEMVATITGLREPGDIAADGRLAYVAEGAGTFSYVNLASRKVFGTSERTVNTLALDERRQRLYLCVDDDPNVQVLDTSGPESAGSFSVTMDAAEGIVCARVDSSTGDLYVGDMDTITKVHDGQLSVHHIEQDSHDPWLMQGEEGRLYVPGPSEVLVVSLATMAVERRIPVPENPVSLARDAVSNVLFVATFNGDLLAIDLASDTRIARVPIGAYGADLLLDAPRSRLLLIYPETSRVEAMTWV